MWRDGAKVAARDQPTMPGNRRDGSSTTARCPLAFLRRTDPENPIVLHHIERNAVMHTGRDVVDLKRISRELRNCVHGVSFHFCLIEI